LIILETSGIGQSGSEITEIADVSMYVMTPEYGASTQLEKIDMLDYADLIVLNKSDKRDALDALQAVRKQYQRNHVLFDKNLEEMPVFSTKASQFNDWGTTEVFNALVGKINEKFESLNLDEYQEQNVSEDSTVIPPKRVRYLSEIVENNRGYDKNVEEQALIAKQMYLIDGAKKFITDDPHTHDKLEKIFLKTKKDLLEENSAFLRGWHHFKEDLKADSYSYFVRGKEIKVETTSESLSGLKIPKISLPKFQDWGDLIRWKGQENVPGQFPFTAGIYPFKRTGEDPTRMFAGEGGPERTNRRFHYVSAEMPAKRLSTAFDSVTLYGQDPAFPPDIYGKIGNAGVSIATLDDAKKLYSGFDLVNALTSVSMTINGPAPMLLSFFMNAAIDQNCEKYIEENNLWDIVEEKLKAKFDDKGLKRPTYSCELPPSNNGLGLKLLGITGDEVLDKEVYEKIKAETIATVRGTVQADILKEDQAQNTCIFSTEFALRLMGDVQEYFIENKVRNFYSVSISGYHIAEA